MGIAILVMELAYGFYRQEYVNWSWYKKIGNQELKANFERLIVTTILDYKQQFMGNLHEMHSSLQT